LETPAEVNFVFFSLRIDVSTSACESAHLLLFG